MTIRLSRGHVAPIVIALVAFAIRVWWAAPFAAIVQFSDPDGYVTYARELAGPNRAWRWSWSAVEYHEFYKAPLYQVALSALVRWLSRIDVVRWVIVGHAALGAATALALYVIGVAVLSRAAGLWASAVYAAWIPNILITATAWQEHLYVPLLFAGFASLARAIDRDWPARRWTGAGVLFGLAALTRSSVAYFIPLVIVVCALRLHRDRRSLGRVAALLAGWLLVVAPYVLALSTSVGRFVFIEDIGAFALKHGRSAEANARGLNIAGFRDASRGPTGGEVVRFLLAEYRLDPARFVGERAALLRSLLKPPGGNVLLDISAASATGALLAKSAVHLLMDVPFVVAVAVSPFGIVVARRRGIAALLALWIVELSALLALTGWAGTRFRSPIEPAFITLAAVAVAGDWRPSWRLSWAAAWVSSLVLAAIVVIGGGDTARRRVTYGFTPWPAPDGTTRFAGDAAMNVIAGQRIVEFSVRPIDARPERPVAVSVDLGGRPADRFTMSASEERHLRYVVRAPGVVYVRVRAAADGEPAPMLVRVGAAERF